MQLVGNGATTNLANVGPLYYSHTGDGAR